MQNEETVKAEPKGMQINYTYIFYWQYKHVLEGKVGQTLIDLC